jgi:hypothetical protein
MTLRPRGEPQTPPPADAGRPHQPPPIEITNTDDRAHDFAIEAANLNTSTIQASAAATATFTVPEGTTKFKCTFHRGMTGTIEGVDQAEG